MIAGLLLSLLTHAAIAVAGVRGVASAGDRNRFERPDSVLARLELDEPPPPPPEEDQQRIRLGREDSETDSETWLGSNMPDPGAPQGPTAAYDQAALARPAGEPSLEPIPAGAPELIPSNPEPFDVVANDPAHDAQQESPRTPDDGDDEAEQPTVAPPEGAGVADTPEPPERSEQPTDEADEENATPDRPDEQAATPQPAVASMPSPPSAGAPGAPTPMGLVPEQDPGEISESESPAAAKDRPITVRPGQPAAGRGLEITTTRPRFANLTLLTASPRDAIARIAFGRDGKPVKVELVQSTGRPDVDQPLLNALYQWRAKGKELLALPEPLPGREPATIDLTFRIVLSR